MAAPTAVADNHVADRAESNPTTQLTRPCRRPILSIDLRIVRFGLVSATHAVDQQKLPS